jgi:hypothetical protein
VEQKEKKISRKETYIVTSRRGFDNAKEKRIAFLMMQNFCRQAGHLIIKNRYLLRQIRSLAGFIKCHLSLAFG